MPFALVFIGLLLIVTGAKDTYREFGSELVSDFTGEGNFTWWIASVGIVGALGYIKPLEQFSRWFMALIIVAMFISNRGVFAQLNDALAAGPTKPSTEGKAATGTQNTDLIGIPASLNTLSDNNTAAQSHFATVVEAAKALIPFFA